MGELSQTSRMFTDASGRPVPIMKAKYGSTKSQAVTTSSSNALAINSSQFKQPIRLWAVGCSIYYITGPSDVGAATATGGFVGQDQRVETWLEESETHIKAIAASGSGTLVIELLG